jgi:hypothetical protein
MILVKNMISGDFLKYKVNEWVYKHDGGNGHPALCSSVLYTS